MSIEENKALVQRCFDLWNARDSDAAGDTYTPDFVYHGPPGEFHGRDGIKELWSAFLVGFPDLEASVDGMVAEGDRVVVRWTARGTHTGNFQGIAPTSREIALAVIEEFRVVDGMLAECWEAFDQLSLTQQIGALPVPPVS